MHVKLLRIVHLSRIWQHFSDVVYSFLRYKSQKLELWNNHWKQACSSRKVSTNRCSKTPTIDILKCYWGYTLVDWNPGSTSEVSNVSYFCFACVMPFFVNNSKKLVVLFHRQCSLMPIFWVLQDPSFILSPLHSPINWLPEHRFSRCQEAPIREWEGRLCQHVCP